MVAISFRVTDRLRYVMIAFIPDAIAHQGIWKNYRGWLRTVTSPIPTEETVRSVVQEDLLHNFRVFSNTEIYRKIMSKSSIINT